MPTIRSAKAVARSTWWMLRMVGTPSSRATRTRSLMTCHESSTSRLATGSSARRTRGCWARARAIATRCFSPPDNRSARFVARCTRLTRSRLRTAISRSALLKYRKRLATPRLYPRRPHRTLSSTGRRSTRLNSCHTNPTDRRRSWRSLPTIAEMSLPSRRMRPSVTRCRPLMVRSNVDLPAPERPMRATISPLRAAMSTDARAWYPFG